VGVYCHDLDAFRCILEPHRDRRPWWFRCLTGRALAGLRRAAVVFHSTNEIRDELLRLRVCPAEKLVLAPYGTAAEFTPTPDPTALSPPPPRPYLLHVGGDMARKRLDVLIDVFAELSRRRPDLHLVQVGPPWSAERAGQIARLGLGERVVKLAGLTRAQLAELYRRAAAVLVPSEAEGFGLPVIEALACGAVVVASDIPVLREVGGPAALYAPVADVPTWARVVAGTFDGTTPVPAWAERLAWAGQYGWARHARVIAGAYLGLDRVAELGGHSCGNFSERTNSRPRP